MDFGVSEEFLEKWIYLAVYNELRRAWAHFEVEFRGFLLI